MQIFKIFIASMKILKRRTDLILKCSSMKFMALYRKDSCLATIRETFFITNCKKFISQSCKKCT